tara:strand:+ start:824 stop:1051 length:228 start_codon:yes stop_codon:yes gene_type:complete
VINMTWKNIMKEDSYKFRDKFETMDLEITEKNLRERIFKAYQDFQEDLPEEILNEKELIGLFREMVLERIDTLGV